MIKVIHCTVNGKVREIAVDERESLTDMLRLRLGLTSVKKGCEALAICASMLPIGPGPITSVQPPGTIPTRWIPLYAVPAVSAIAPSS